MRDGIGCATFHDLVARFGSAAHAFDATVARAERQRALDAADAALARGVQLGATVFTPGDADFPARLRELREVPPVLWALGDLALLDDARPAVAIVGTRRATAYGERATRAIAGALARAGACIVSGMARGIDACAHRAALESSGATIAVLGTGVDVAYPVAHQALLAELCAHGLVLSEYPPGERANGGSFPRRNRIIAALAQATIVVEAGAKSGALITANDAEQLGRTVAAVPGPIDQPQSEGTNLLLRDGAQFIASVEDALALVGLTRAVRRPTVAPDSDEANVWRALGDGAADLEAICGRTRLPADRCLAAITALELAGAVECTLTGVVQRRIG